MASDPQPLVGGQGGPIVSDMAPNAFIGKDTCPTDAELADALSSAMPVLDQLIADLAADGVTIREWSSYSRKAGWALRLKRGKRTIVWIGPCNGCFRVSFVLGDKALTVARESALPESVLKVLDESPKYAEGTGVRLLVKRVEELAPVKKLAEIKIAN